MKQINLYRYEEANGVVVIAPEARTSNDTPYKIRLVAEENCILIKEDIETPVIDTSFEDVENWREVTIETEDESSTLDPDDISSQEFMALIEEAL